MKTNRIKDLTNVWLKQGDSFWYYIIYDYGIEPYGHIVDCINYYNRPYNVRGAPVIKFLIASPHKFVDSWQPFEPTIRHKRLVMKTVFR